jgi:hypothetical protein
MWRKSQNHAEMDAVAGEIDAKSRHSGRRETATASRFSL